MFFGIKSVISFTNYLIMMINRENSNIIEYIRFECMRMMIANVQLLVNRAISVIIQLQVIVHLFLL